MKEKAPTAGIILAAGMSNRFGQPKQLVRFQGRTLIETVVDAALGSQLEHIALVLGHACDESLRALSQRVDNPRLDILENEDYSKGMSLSIQMGLRKVKHDYPSVMFLLADQPLIRSEMIDLLLKKYWSSDKDICVPCSCGQRGNPTIFSRRFYDQIFAITGDTGARKIIDHYPDQVLQVELDDPVFFSDIDTPDDLDVLNKGFKNPTF
jgi:molybdenum cofactor cytidylyltransferase